MNEELYEAFIRISAICSSVEYDGNEGTQNDLVLIGKALGLTNKQLHEEFPELYKKDEDED